MKKTNKIKGQYRQGDVLIQENVKIPKHAVQAKPIHGKIVLAEGEVTGHAHSIEADAADWWKSSEGEQQFVQTKAFRRATVKHQEHGPIPLRTGKPHRIVRQRQYTPMEIQRVKD